jgi:glycylpeptide N-tetradecanoyltransferase
MAESKQVTYVDDESQATLVEDGPEEDESTIVPESSTKSKKKKKKSKLKNILSKKPNEDAEAALAQMEEAIASTSLDEPKSLSKDQQKKLEKAIAHVNQVLPGGKKGLSDHKFWKTQPVLKFGLFTGGKVNLDETVSEEGQIQAPQPDLVPKEPIKIGGDLEFVDMNLEDETEVSLRVYCLTISSKKYTNSSRGITLKTMMRAFVSHTPPPF